MGTLIYNFFFGIACAASGAYIFKRFFNDNNNNDKMHIRNYYYPSEFNLQVKSLSSKTKMKRKFRKFKIHHSDGWLERYKRYYQNCVLNDKIPFLIPVHREEFLSDEQIVTIKKHVNKLITQSLQVDIKF